MQSRTPKTTQPKAEPTNSEAKAGRGAPLLVCWVQGLSLFFKSVGLGVGVQHFGLGRLKVEEIVVWGFDVLGLRRARRVSMFSLAQSSCRVEAFDACIGNSRWLFVVT